MRVIIEFTDDEMELLKKPIPYSPCIKCGNDSTWCMGCDEAKKYKEIIKEYKDKGLYDYACLLGQKYGLKKIIKRRKNELEDLKKELDDLIDKLPDQLKDL